MRLSLYLTWVTRLPMIYAQLRPIWARLNKDASYNRSFYFLSVLDLTAQITFLIFFTPRITNYNLRGNGLNVVQPSYNSLVMHNSFLYEIAHIQNQLSAITKSSTTLAQFRSRLNGVEFAGCPCMNCIRQLFSYLNVCTSFFLDYLLIQFWIFLEFLFFICKQ